MTRVRIDCLFCYFSVVVVPLFAAEATWAFEGGRFCAPFQLNEVRLLDSRLKAEQDRNQQYLLSFDNDQLLYNFRRNAGLETPGKTLRAVGRSGL